MQEFVASQNDSHPGIPGDLLVLPVRLNESMHQLRLLRAGIPLQDNLHQGLPSLLPIVHRLQGLREDRGLLMKEGIVEKKERLSGDSGSLSLSCAGVWICAIKKREERMSALSLHHLIGRPLRIVVDCGEGSVLRERPAFRRWEGMLLTWRTIQIPRDQ
jgi:hypothetical protein